MSVYRRLPTVAILLSSLAVILLQQFVDLSWIYANPYGNYYLKLGYYLRLIIHEPGFNYPPFVGLYPIIPWIGVIGLGWCFGVLLSRYDPAKIRSLKLPMALTGLASLVLFAVGGKPIRCEAMESDAGVVIVPPGGKGIVRSGGSGTQR